ncbi:hypothetical protein LSUE1_G004675, partial [Lachnellula suecica]
GTWLAPDVTSPDAGSVIRYIRARKSGTIRIWSRSHASYGLYSGSKVALEGGFFHIFLSTTPYSSPPKSKAKTPQHIGLNEALASELSPFNIRLLFIEPGAFRTSFLSSSLCPQAPMSAA